MRDNRSTHRRGAHDAIRAMFLGAGAAAAAVFAAAPAAGQGAGDPSQALAGPRVQDDHAPGVSGAFSSMMENSGDKRPDEGRVPHEVFARAVWGLRGETVEPGLRLTAAQVEAMEIAEREYRDALREFRREHAAELRELRAALGEGTEPARAREAKPGAGEGAGAGAGPKLRGKASPEKTQTEDARRGGKGGAKPNGAQPGGAGGPMDRRLDRPLERAGDRGAAAPSEMNEDGAERALVASDDPAQDRQRERLRELLAQRPTGDEQRVRVWGVLNEAQRAHVQGEIDAWRADWLAQRKIDAGKLPPGFAEREAMGRDEARKRLEERIKDLPPRQQEAARRKFEEEMRTREAGSGAAPGEKKGEAKPAPGMDSVDVPPPKRD